MKNSMNGVIKKSEWYFFDLILFIALFPEELFPKSNIKKDSVWHIP